MGDFFYNIAYAAETAAVSKKAFDFSTLINSFPRAGIVTFFIVGLIVFVELFILRIHKNNPDGDNSQPIVPPENPSPPIPPDQQKKQFRLPVLHLPKNILPFVLLGFVLITIPVVLLQVKNSQDIRNKAAEEWLPGCCGDDAHQCRSWERCEKDNGACPAPAKSCCSTAGCATDSDCCGSNKCVNNTCVGSGVLECSTGKNGVTVVNHTGTDIVCSGSTATCQHTKGTKDQCTASDTALDCRDGTQQINNLSIKNGETKSWGMQISCGNWQADVQLNCGTYSCSNSAHGCEWNDQLCTPSNPTPTSLPTPTPTTTVTGCYKTCTPQTTICGPGLVCADSNGGFGVPLYGCLNPSCPESPTCICTTPSVTPTITITPTTVQSFDCQCENVTADKTVITRGDSVNFTGFGWVTDQSDKVDLIRFIIKKSTVNKLVKEVTAVRDTSRDTTGKYYYKAVLSYVPEEDGSDFQVFVEVHSVKLGWRPRN